MSLTSWSLEKSYRGIFKPNKRLFDAMNVEQGYRAKEYFLIHPKGDVAQCVYNEIDSLRRLVFNQKGNVVLTKIMTGSVSKYFGFSTQEFAHFLIGVAPNDFNTDPQYYVDKRDNKGSSFVILVFQTNDVNSARNMTREEIKKMALSLLSHQYRLIDSSFSFEPRDYFQINDNTYSFVHKGEKKY